MWQGVYGQPVLWPRDWWWSNCTVSLEQSARRSYFGLAAVCRHCEFMEHLSDWHRSQFIGRRRQQVGTNGILLLLSRLLQPPGATGESPSRILGCHHSCRLHCYSQSFSRSTERTAGDCCRIKEDMQRNCATERVFWKMVVPEDLNKRPSVRARACACAYVGPGRARDHLD